MRYRTRRTRTRFSKRRGVVRGRGRYRARGRSRGRGRGRSARSGIRIGYRM